MRIGLAAAVLIVVTAVWPGAARANATPLDIGWVKSSSAALDGLCDPNEYSNPAIGPAEAVVTGVRDRTVYLMHDGQHLWACFTARPSSWGGGVAVYVDPDADSEDGKGGPGDFVVYVPFPSEQRWIEEQAVETRSKEASQTTAPWGARWEDGWQGKDPGGWAAVGSFAQGGLTWSAEVRIAASAVTTAPWNTPSGLMLEWGDTLVGGSAIGWWPARDTWGEVVLSTKRLLAFPKLIDFGYVADKNQYKIAFGFQNFSSTWATLDPVSWSITGPDASSFQLDSSLLNTYTGVVFLPDCCGWPVSEVVFSPGRSGGHSATLTLSTPADNSPHSIALYGFAYCSAYCP